MASRFIRLARTGKPHGLKGEIKIDITTDDPALLKSGLPLWLEREGGPAEKIEVETLHTQAPARMKLPGVNDRDAAAEYAGRDLCIDAADLPEAPQGSYWVHEIVGYQVVDASRGELGTLKAVVPTGANDCFEVQPKGRDSYLVPVTDQTLKAVDHGSRQISMDLLEGSVPGELDDED